MTTFSFTQPYFHLDCPVNLFNSKKEKYAKDELGQLEFRFWREWDSNFPNNFLQIFLPPPQAGDGVQRGESAAPEGHIPRKWEYPLIWFVASIRNTANIPFLDHRTPRLQWRSQDFTMGDLLKVKSVFFISLTASPYYWPTLGSTRLNLERTVFALDWHCCTIKQYV